MPTDSVDPGADESVTSRRRWLSRLSIGLGTLAAGVAGVPILGFILAPFIHPKPEHWRAVGRVSDFPMDGTKEVTFENPSPVAWAGQVARTAAWLRREGENEFTAFAIDCTHLGCPVRWEARADLFMCPCHGGVYYKNGDVAGGPPPRPLTRYPVRVRGDRVEIHTTPLPIT